jgi:DNA-directed RNA polymerase delta subunit
MNLLEQIIEVLEQSKEPIHYNEIANKIKDINFSKSETALLPFKIYQTIYRSIQKNEESSPIFQKQKSVFGLKKIHTEHYEQPPELHGEEVRQTLGHITYPNLKFNCPEFESLSEIVSGQKIENLGLSTRASRVVNNLNIVNIADFIALLRDGSDEKPKNMGRATHREIIDSVKALAQSIISPEYIDWMVYAEKRGFAVLPIEHIVDFSALVENLDSFFYSFVEQQYAPEFLTIYKNRWSPKNSSNHTLESLGGALGVTRERVRQMECIFFDAIRGALLHGDYQGLKIRFRPEVESICRKTNNHFEDLGKTAWLQSAWLNEIGRLHEIDGGKLISKANLLIELFGFELRNDLSRPSEQPFVFSLGLSKDEINKTLEVVSGIYDVLSKEPLGLDAIDMFNSLPNKLGGSLLLRDLAAYIELCPWIEIIGDEIYRLKFPYISLRSDEIFRVLADAGEPLPREDILRILNSLSSKNPINSLSNLVNQMAEDKRFKAIGKSGQWALADWGVETRAIPKVIEEILTQHGSPMDVEEITNLVQNARSASKVSVAMYLNMKSNIFYRYSRGVYGLSIWIKGCNKFQAKSIYRRKKPLQSDLIIEKAIEMLKPLPEMSMPLVELAKKLEVEFQVIRNTIYGAISQATELESIPFQDKPGKICRLKQKHQ